MATAYKVVLRLGNGRLVSPCIVDKIAYWEEIGWKGHAAFSGAWASSLRPFVREYGTRLAVARCMASPTVKSAHVFIRECLSLMRGLEIYRAECELAKEVSTTASLHPADMALFEAKDGAPDGWRGQCPCFRVLYCHDLRLVARVWPKEGA